MTTLSEIIDKVVVTTTRSDLESSMILEIANSVSNCHKIDKFAKDITTFQVKDPFVSSGNVSLSISTSLPKFREVAGTIKVYSNYTTVGPLTTGGTQLYTQPFQNLISGQSEFDYYGYKYSNTYTQLGNYLNLSGVPDTTKLIEIQALKYPTTGINVSTGVLETDSWIMENYSSLVEAFLLRYVAIIMKDKDLISAAGSLIQQYRHDLISTEVLLK